MPLEGEVSRRNASAWPAGTRSSKPVPRGVPRGVPRAPSVGKQPAGEALSLVSGVLIATPLTLCTMRPEAWEAKVTLFPLNL
jgi:hypothetical protein